MSCICITTSTPTQTDRLWEVRNLITAWNKNMENLYVPSWVSCLNESMSIWNMRWTCPGYVFCPQKPHPVGNEYHAYYCWWYDYNPLCCQLIMYTNMNRRRANEFTTGTTYTIDLAQWILLLLVHQWYCKLIYRTKLKQIS